MFLRASEELTAALSDGSWAEFRRLARAFSPLAWAFVLGSTAGAVILAGLGYLVSHAMIVAHRKRQGEERAVPN